MTFIIGVAGNILSVLFFSIINVIIRSLKDVHPSIIATFQSTGNFVVSFIVLLIYRILIVPNGFYYNITITEILLLLCSGIVRSFAMMFFIKAF